MLSYTRIHKIPNFVEQIVFMLKQARRSQSIEIDIGNQSIHSISIADCYRLISVINNNRTHRKRKR